MDFLDRLMAPMTAAVMTQMASTSNLLIIRHGNGARAVDMLLHAE